MRTFSRRTDRRLHLGKDYALVFIGQERRRDAHEQPDHAGDDQCVHQERRDLVLDHVTHAALVAQDATVEGAVEPAEETTLGLAVFSGSIGLSMVAHKAGVKISATSTDNAMAETMVMENCL